MLDWLGLSKKPQQEQVIPTTIIQDQVPEIKVAIPDTKPVSLMPSVRSLVLGYHNQRSAGRGAFRPSEYDLAEMGRIEDTDSYVRQAFEKKTALMFKEGWGLVGKNPRTIKYVKSRLAQIAQASNTPTNTLFRNIGSNIVRKSNSFLLKVRKTEASGGKVRTIPGSNTTLQPVAGYFPIPSETMEFELTGTKISRWKQKMPNGEYKLFSPQDIIHIFHARKDGFVFGTPGLIPVIDDIRALRKIEENVELLIYQHLFPLFQYKVGTPESPAGFTEDGQREIDVVRTEIQFMPTEGGIVTPERHEITAIGSEGRALRIESYLEHFKNRVFSGLGVSAVDMGEGDCYSNDTQTLTENGWKYHWEIDHENEKIATYNPETNELEYHISNYKYEGHYEGDMILFKGKHVDVKVTPHHDMWVLNRFTGETQKVHAIDLYENWDQSEFCFIDSVSGFDGISSDIQVGDSLIDPQTWMEFLGWWISEGSVDRFNAKQGRYRTIITQKKLRDIESIRTCLSKLPFNFREEVDKQDGTVNFVIYSKALFEKLEPIGTSLNKFIPKEFLEYNTEFSEIFLTSLMRGDGTWDKRNGRKSGVYYTGSKQLANDVQILALHAGYSAKVTQRKNNGFNDGTIYRVLITKSDKNYRILNPDHISKESYSNTIYCYNVPNHLFITRRNGIVGIHGNTANRACYSEDTQTLTDSGFKYYWQITPEDKIATFNPKTEELEYHYPNGDILLYDYSGKMVAFRNRNIDVLVTPDHDMWVGQPGYSKDLDWQKIHADSINEFQFKFRTGGLGWTGIDPENFQLPHVPYQCHSIVPNSGPFPRIDIHDWLEFLGYFVSEGCLAKSKNKWAITLSQNERVNPIKTERIRQCLNRLPFKYNEYTDPKDQTTHFWINCKSLYLYLQEKCGDYSYLKHLPHEILEYKRDYLDTLFDALMLGDETVDKREGRTSRTYYSNSEVLLDQVQEIALKLGYRAHILPGSRCGRVCISENTVSNIVKRINVFEVDYSGKVYCFNIPNHLFITRRNGRIGIHGNTADNMSRNLVDAVKDLQQIVEDAINQEIINELLLESNFGVDVLDEENIVRLKFKEIDVDAQIKKENHGADLFAKDIIDHDEARARLGLEPWVVPNPEEVQAGTDTPEEFPQWHKSRWKMFELPKLLIQAVDEPWSPAAIAAAGDSSLPMTEKDNEEFAKQQNEQEIVLEKEKTKAKVAVAKAKQRPTARKDGYLRSTFLQTKKDIVGKVSIEKTIDHDWTASLIRTQMSTTVNRILADQLIEFRKGYSQFASVETQQFMSSTTSARLQLRERSETFINKLTENVISALRRNVNPNSDDLVEKTRAVFESVEFRTSFIEDVEIKKAHSLGIALAIRDTNASVLLSNKTSHDQACATCSSKNGQGIAPAAATLDILPPHHAGCSCSLVLAQTTIQNSVINDARTPTATLNKGVKKNIGSNRAQFRRCTSKYKAALKSQDPNLDENLLNTLAEAACNFLLSDKVEEDIEDATLEECVLSIKKSLRKEHPDWDEDKIKSSAFAICKSRNKGD